MRVEEVFFDSVENNLDTPPLMRVKEVPFSFRAYTLGFTPAYAGKRLTKP